MMKNLKPLVGALAAAILMAGSLAAQAATTTQNITLTGTVAPPPATCSIGGGITLAFNASIPTTGGNAGYVLTQVPTNISVTCSPNTTYAVYSTNQYFPLNIGGVAEAAFAVISGTSGGQSIVSAPIQGTGTGSAQTLSIYGKIVSPSLGPLDPTKVVGAISGTATLQVFY